MPTAAFILALLALPVCPAAGMITTGAYVETPVTLDRPGARLAGRLMRPNRPGPHPAVVILHGGGRGGQVNYTPRYIASRLARCGVAALIYDKRGTGTSGGDFAATTFDDLVADAAAAVAFLRRQPGIDRRRVGLVGLSQGGRLAPAVAERAGGIAFIATASAPFVSAARTRLHALRSRFRDHPYPEAWEAEALDLWRQYLDRRSRDLSTAPLDARIRRLRYLPARLLPPSSDAPLRTPFYNSLDRDPAAALERLAVPFLALYGSEDTQVPVAESIRQLRRRYAVPGLLDIRLIPGVDHAFRYPAGGAPRYRFEDAVLAWIRARTGSPPCLPAAPPDAVCLP